jgi:hypothetical protein
LLLSQAFSVGIPLTMGFRLSWSLWLSQSPFTNFSSFTMEFWPSRSLSHEIFFFHDGILAITKPFTRTFVFSRWNSSYHEAFHTNFFFFFYNGILAITEPFSQIFLSHDGISAITKPFHKFLFHTMESRLSRRLFTIFPFTRWNLGY